MGSYFISYFEVAAIIIFVILILMYSQQNFIINKAHYIFLWLWLFAFLIPVTDILSVWGMDKKNYLVFTIFNSLYYISQELTAAMLLLYTVAPLWRRERASKLKIAICTAPVLIAIGIVVLNIFNNCLFYLDISTGDYYYGPLQPIIYVAPIFYFIYSLYFIYARGDVYNEHSRNAIVNAIVVIVGFIGVGFLFPRLLTRGFAIAIAMLQVFMVTLNSHAKQDPRTKLLNKDAFYDQVNSLIYNKIPFNVMAVRIADYEILVSNYGLDLVQRLALEVIMDNQEYIPVNRGYGVQQDLVCIIFENQTEEEKRRIELALDKNLSYERFIDDMQITYSHFLVTFSFPDRFESVEELRNLIVYLERMHRMRYGLMDVEEFTLRNLKRERAVIGEITKALKNQGFEMFYQPMYSIKENKFTTAEALIRMKQTALGYIGPQEFIPIAERAGYIVEIGDYVMEAVFKFIGEHDIERMGIEYIELNLSTIQCLQRDFISKTLACAKRHNVKPEQVCFEITETASNCSPEIFLENLKILRRAGYKLAIDDFGTGYGNLHRLISMDFEIVKFDKDTTQQTYEDEKLREVSNKMLAILHSMGSKVVNEGVETEEEYNYFKEIGTDYIQGYYFSKPIPEQEYIDFVMEKNHE